MEAFVTVSRVPVEFTSTSALSQAYCLSHLRFLQHIRLNFAVGMTQLGTPSETFGRRRLLHSDSKLARKKRICPASATLRKDGQRIGAERILERGEATSTEGNGAMQTKEERVNGKERNGAVKSLEKREGFIDAAQSNGLREVQMQPLSVQDYMERAPMFIKRDGGPPRWFCPTECGQPPNDAPLLLFLPGMDGTGLGLLLHYEGLGKMFEVHCLHIPVVDRTPLEGLIMIVEETLDIERINSPSRPVYLVGDSLGGALALAIASRNPDMDLLLVLVNPATCFNQSQLQPLLPLIENLPTELYQGIPLLLSFIMGDLIRMAMVKVESKLPPNEKARQLSDNLATLLPTLPTLAGIVPKKTLSWKLYMLKSAAMYANSRLHAVKAQVLVLASGKDQLLPSNEEAKRLKKSLNNCIVRYFKDNGHSLLLEEGIDLATTIKGAGFYRCSMNHDPVSDFIYPSTKEFEKAFEQVRFIWQLCSPVLFSTNEDGKVIRDLSGIPLQSPVLLVGNHMLMGLELGIIIGQFLKQKNHVVRGLAHPILFTRLGEAELTEAGFNDNVRVFGGVPATKKNFFKVLSRRESALLYPGGAREALHRKGEAYKLFWPEQSEFVRMAARFGVTIIPFGVVGEDDILEIVLDYDELMKIPVTRDLFNDWNKKAPRLRINEVGEVAKQNLHIPLMMPKPPGRLYFMFGKPFPTAGRMKELRDKDNANRMYSEVKKEVEGCLEYLQEKRKEDPYRNFLPRFVLETLQGGDWQAPTFEP